MSDNFFAEYSGSSGGGGGSGTVTSVALSVPSILSVAGSPITTSGTLAVTLATQSAHLFFAGPSVGSATPTFRTIGAGDLVVGGSAGQVLQNNGIATPMTWVTRPTLALDNLASVAINTSLLPGTTNTINLGSTSKAWSNAYVSSSIRGTIASGYIDMSGMSLYDNPGVISLNWNTRSLRDASNFASVDWASRLLDDSSGNQALDWSDGYLNATNGIRLNGATSGAITHQAAAVTTDYTVIWPAAQGASSTFLQNDGAGNLSWASGGASANQSLSNLTNPTAINQDLIFDKASAAFVQTKNDSITTYAITFASGNSSASTSGAVNISSGASGGGSSGLVTISTGTSGITSGSVLIFTGSNIGGLTGDLISISGSNSAGGSSGAFTAGTGEITDSSGQSGTVILSSGPTADGNSGTVSVGSGSTSGAGASGAFTLSSGASSAGISGIVSLKSGNADATTGDVQVTSGNSATDASGNIILQIGTAGTTRGTLQFVDGSEGSANRVWISSNTFGAGNWDTTGASGSFTTVDLKTVTVVNGLITSIV